MFDPLGDPVHTLDDHTYTLDPARRNGLIVDPLATAVDIQELTVF